jgi:hypothetical protein
MDGELKKAVGSLGLNGGRILCFIMLWRNSGSRFLAKPICTHVHNLRIRDCRVSIVGVEEREMKFL